MKQDSIKTEYLKNWMKSGNKVVGYYCSNLPEQLIHAAGILPYRMRGIENEDFLLSDAILSRFNCTFIRSTLNLALKGKYDFLDGLLVANTCDHVRRMFDIFKLKVDRALAGDMKLMFLSMPHVFTTHGFNWYLEEIRLLLKIIGEYYSIDVESQEYLTNLKQSIEIYKQNSALLQQLDKLRSSHPPKISGTRFFEILLEQVNMRKEDSNQFLTGTIKEIENKAEEITPRARLLLIGSSIDNSEFVSILEHNGGVVVADTTCLSLNSMEIPRKLENLKNEESELNALLSELVNETYLKCLCPRMMNAHDFRLGFIKDLIAKKKIDGVILQYIEFCDLHGCENAIYRHELDTLGIPTLTIDREYFLGDTGRLRTRVEAFLEKIERK